MLETMKKNYIFAVVRGKDAEDGYQISKGAIQGGIKNIEVAYTTPGATQVIERLVEEFKEDTSVVVGAGTVMDGEMATQAMEAGAKFLVSPHYSQEVMDVAKARDTYYLPGCGTVTEIVNAVNQGAPIVKLFPGGLLGPSFIKDVHGPLPDVELMPSGGVSLENIREWRDKGAVAVGVGSALSKTVPEKGYAGVAEEAQKFVKALEG
ncbi:bifunctional 4-hydroxy-2-oxoglutarate aldolase/2-dehydro-3-deoxy-phosphogluconate aldolase [Fundicoccus culcitae]|uniref:Bifunctional 4-hydroxy-2-oxoglutarate aldolase/2-dehydro-3-deoxy-phosphogluconate aldolase n=1 Tax=Fundicoccus culcitae TaxID=2969821 RepID=A0ABY5P4X3_9LACT|nr:bifunctional 4-hydroxy-2-oxoglutarate aldolase/2-dehydro-3-deoxy-phosphogluconate aldolase [Fundicoccus culcitae]UUX33806.1 bifunctional 4-hydroxy-2-oxoglutarate aldolase/2-dehydro-3-deoxy-phosphogluconate aldolase [Fundicoccus culcitae]